MLKKNLPLLRHTCLLWGAESFIFYFEGPLFLLVYSLMPRALGVYDPHHPAGGHISSLSSFIMITDSDDSKLTLTATGIHSRVAMHNSKREMEEVYITLSTI